MPKKRRLKCQNKKAKYTLVMAFEMPKKAYKFYEIDPKTEIVWKNYIYQMTIEWEDESRLNGLCSLAMG